MAIRLKYGQKMSRITNLFGSSVKRAACRGLKLDKPKIISILQEMKKVVSDNTQVHKDEHAFMKTFSSQEEAELYHLRRSMDRSDMEKFHLFCRMLRIGKMLSSAKITNR
ncbi:MAG: hypothetical protein E6Q24_10335 [Chitinophagaceae bacterium]|nr:MAG: hypothetical protein E6Q24_10335 [Chitinophagaceae bacterium]